MNIEEGTVSIKVYLKALCSECLPPNAFGKMICVSYILLVVKQALSCLTTKSDSHVIASNVSWLLRRHGRCFVMLLLRSKRERNDDFRNVP